MPSFWTSPPPPWLRYCPYSSDPPFPLPHLETPLNSGLGNEWYRDKQFYPALELAKMHREPSETPQPQSAPFPCLPSDRLRFHRANRSLGKIPIPIRIINNIRKRVKNYGSHVSVIVHVLIEYYTYTSPSAAQLGLQPPSEILKLLFFRVQKLIFRPKFSIFRKPIGTASKYVYLISVIFNQIFEKNSNFFSAKHPACQQLLCLVLQG